MSAPLILAVPSKGRLQENAADFFARAGLTIKRKGGARNYRGRIVELDAVEVAFLSASEITNELAEGNVHLGVTGEDLVRERMPDADGVVDLVTPLGFGHADVVIAVPRAWIDVRSMADLVDVAQGFRSAHGRRMRVATKYSTLTAKFFARHNLSDYRLVESLGATEGAPAAGSAEIIVDITSTGSTLTANDLKVPQGCVILPSQANLVASLKANWTGTARKALGQMLDQVAAEERARSISEIRADWPEDASASTVAKIAGETAGELIEVEGSRAILHVQKADIYSVAAELKSAGAIRTSVFKPDYVFEHSNPLLAGLLSKLPPERT